MSSSSSGGAGGGGGGGGDGVMEEVQKKEEEEVGIENGSPPQTWPLLTDGETRATEEREKKVKASRPFEPLLPHLNLSLNRPTLPHPLSLLVCVRASVHLDVPGHFPPRVLYAAVRLIVGEETKDGRVGKRQVAPI